MTPKCGAQKVLGSDSCSFTCDLLKGHKSAHCSYDEEDETTVVWPVPPVIFLKILHDVIKAGLEGEGHESPSAGPR